MKRLSILVVLLVTVLSVIPAESRSASVDFIVLVDTSLSMADAIADARRYAAGEIIGRYVERGDWVALLSFYGKTELVWQGDITTEADIAAVVRSLHELKADGRFTDIGGALDAMDILLQQRGHPERPKYVVLLTDERQEAPGDSRYYSQNYVVSHPLLEYVKRVDLGSFRAITIGYGLSARVELEARTLMTTLSEPPSRPREALPGAGTAGQSIESRTPAADSGQGASGPSGQAALSGSAGAGGAGSGVGAKPEAAASGGTAGLGSGFPRSGAQSGTRSGAQGDTRGGFPGALLAAALAAAGALGATIALVLAIAAKKRRKDAARRVPPAGPNA